MFQPARSNLSITRDVQAPANIPNDTDATKNTGPSSVLENKKKISKSNAAEATTEAIAATNFHFRTDLTQ